MKNQKRVSITIIGANSWLYQQCKIELGTYLNVVELSHNDLNSIHQLINPVVFSYSKSPKENIEFLNDIIKKTIGKITLISSTAAEVYQILPYYKYPKLKWLSELEIMKFEGPYNVLRVGIVKTSHIKINNYFGSISISTPEGINKTIVNIYLNDAPQGIINCFENIRVEKSKFLIINKILTILYNISPWFIYLLRPFDLLLKKLGYKNYGYTFIANKLNETI